MEEKWAVTLAEFYVEQVLKRKHGDVSLRAVKLDFEVDWEWARYFSEFVNHPDPEHSKDASIPEKS